MSRIALLSYNNYYNRLFKIEDSLSAYLTAATSYTLLDNINFNPADGVTTSLIVGKGQAPFTTWESGSPDYLIVYKTTTEDVIVSRWFILDEDRTRDGQWKISLRRDLLADFNEELATAPIYVEKGIIQDLDNPLLLNNESLVVNQIKKDEILLKDLSKCPWLVMYIKKGVLGGKPFGEEGSRTGVVTLDVPQDDSFVYKTLTVPFTQWAYHQYNTIDYKYAVRHEFRVNYKGIPSYSNTNGYKMYKLVAWNQQSSLTDSINMGTNLTGNTFIDKTRLDNQYKSRINTMVSQANSAFNYHDNADDLLTYNDKVIKDSTGKYYRIHVYTNTAETISNYTVTSSNASTLKNTMTNAWNAANNQSVSPNNSAFYCQLSWKGLRVSWDELGSLETTLDFEYYQGNGTIDNPLFDVICMPYGAVTFSNPSDLLYGITTSAERSMKVMNSLATALTSEYVLDLQILPYCPCQELLQPSNQTIFVLDLVHQGLVGKYNNQITDVVLCCGQTNITFDINKTIDYDNIQSISASYLPENCPDTFVTKYVNDCTLLRLCSPNYNGLFEMNLAKNGGSISNFNVDLTLRPYNPYIHVNPNFNNLYGQDWNDIRGLVCNGDFSIGILNDAWNVYEIQNRNYQNIFDRQIQNLDYNNRINRMESAAQMVAGLVQGAAIGGAAGSVGGKMMGGGSASASAAGAGAGALIGGTLSGLAGTVDMMNLLGRQQEGRNLAIDNFNLQLGNVRALPQSITKTSALTANNKLFPFVEIYECTDVERDAYFNKLKYDGFTLGFITHSFNSFRSSDSSNYFKGQLIRNTAIKGSTHEVNELANELNKGVYI